MNADNVLSVVDPLQIEYQYETPLLALSCLGVQNNQALRSPSVNAGLSASSTSKSASVMSQPTGISGPHTVFPLSQFQCMGSRTTCPPPAPVSCLLLEPIHK